jgi:hypothetical protein
MMETLHFLDVIQSTKAGGAIGSDGIEIHRYRNTDSGMENDVNGSGLDLKALRKSLEAYAPSDGRYFSCEASGFEGLRKQNFHFGITVGTYEDAGGVKVRIPQKMLEFSFSYLKGR